MIAPMRNESEHVRDLAADLAAQDFEGEIEVIVADGGSTDGSRELLEAAAAEHGLALTVLDNPRQIVSPGLNACIQRATGDLIVRVDCHSRYPRDYLRLCAEASAETGAWNVGGIYVAEGVTPVERAIAAAIDSPFGGVNWTRYANATERVDSDTVFCGAFRPVAFERAGLFDESLVRNQDDELNLRIREAGGRIVLDPHIRARYRPRSSFRALWRQYFEYGRWKVPVMRKHGRPGSLRSLVPIVFLGSLVGLGALSPLSGRAGRLLAAEALLYLTCASGASAVALRRRGEPLSLLPLTAAAFGAFHFGYASGMAAGFASAAAADHDAT